MEKKIHFFAGNSIFTCVLALIATVVIFFNSGCDEDEPEPDPTESVTEQITSDSSGGTLTLDHATMEVNGSAIPSLADGSVATVTFSLEGGVPLPETLPAGMTLVGETTLFGPEGFVFQEPIWIKFNIPDDLSLDQVSIVAFYEDRQEYAIVPMSYYDETNRVVGAAVYELGLYFLTNIEGLNRAKANQGCGGFKIFPQYLSGTNYYYHIIITNFTATYPGDQEWWEPYNPATNGGRRYWEYSNVTNVGGYMPDYSKGITGVGMPQGTYSAVLTYSKKNSMFDSPECAQYSIPTTFTINQAYTCDQISCTGLSAGPDFPAGGTWADIECRMWYLSSYAYYSRLHRSVSGYPHLE